MPHHRHPLTLRPLLLNPKRPAPLPEQNLHAQTQKQALGAVSVSSSEAARAAGFDAVVQPLHARFSKRGPKIECL